MSRPKTGDVFKHFFDNDCLKHIVTLERNINAIKVNMVKFNIHWFSVLTSTNDKCMEMASQGADEGLVIAAEFQSLGRGQRGNKWDSERGMNLTFSILARPTFLAVADQFYLSKVTSVAICDWLSAYLPPELVKIKWPNDIYIGNRKVAGLLIENSFSGRYMEISVVGIGINLNQINFSDEIPNPTSLILETGKEILPENALGELLYCFKSRYESLIANERKKIDTDYLNLIYRKDIFCKYYSEGEEFDAKITDVLATGELILQTPEGEVKKFAFKEVTFII